MCAKNLAGDIEVEEPRDDKGEHHAGKEEVEEPVPLPEPPGFSWWCLRSSYIVCFTPLVTELRITQNYHIACS
jgi:hypothetical protein